MTPSVGRIVHDVLPDGPSVGQHRPAIIVRVWDIAGGPYANLVNLQVFTDGRNDGEPDNGEAYINGLAWKTSVHQDPSGKELGTWHQPEYVPEAKAPRPAPPPADGGGVA